MSDTKLKPISPEVTPVIRELRMRSREPTGKFVPWRTVSAKAGESVRWECVDGRWITIALGHDEHAGEALVCNDAGQRVYVDTFDDALELARQWRSG